MKPCVVVIGRAQRLLLAALVMLALGACVKPVVHNFPPDDTGVRLDSTNLPIVWIEVSGDSIMRDTRIGGWMKIIWNGDSLMNYADTLAHPGQRIDYEGYIAVRYRGNSTYNDSPKKPYSFRTLATSLRDGGKKQKVSLLGMGKDNNWALLAPYVDRSLIRDVLTFELARTWMEYVPRGRHCELIVDGTYYGVYVLAEVVSKGKQRLNLKKPGDEGDALTGDYLMEVDCNDDVTYSSRYYPVDTSGKAMTDRRILFQYKSPDHDDLSDAQLDYINRRIDAMEAALASSGNYSRYVDVASFIDYQLMMELCHNVDAYRLSCKFYKRRDSVDPRFKMVLWDTDLAYGNAGHRQGWRTDTWIYRNNNVMYQEKEVYMVPFWWYVLNNDPDYTARLKARWAELRGANLSDDRLMATLDSLAAVLTAHGAVQRNSRAWPCWGEKQWRNQHYIATDYQDEINHIRQWLTARLTWMDTQLQ